MSPWSVHGSDGLPTQSRSKRSRFTVSLKGEAEIGPAPTSSLMRAWAVAALHGGFALGEQGLMKLTTRGSFTQVSPAGHSASPSDGMPHAWVVEVEQNPCWVMKKLPLQNAPARGGKATAAATSTPKAPSLLVDLQELMMVLPLPFIVIMIERSVGLPVTPRRDHVSDGAFDAGMPPSRDSGLVRPLRSGCQVLCHVPRSSGAVWQGYDGPLAGRLAIRAVAGQKGGLTPAVRPDRLTAPEHDRAPVGGPLLLARVVFGTL